MGVAYVVRSDKIKPSEVVSSHEFGIEHALDIVKTLSGFGHVQTYRAGVKVLIHIPVGNQIRCQMSVNRVRNQFIIRNQIRIKYGQNSSNMAPEITIHSFLTTPPVLPGIPEWGLYVRIPGDPLPGVHLEVVYIVLVKRNSLHFNIQVNWHLCHFHTLTTATTTIITSSTRGREGGRGGEGRGSAFSIIQITYMIYWNILDHMLEYTGICPYLVAMTDISVIAFLRVTTAPWRSFNTLS